MSQEGAIADASIMQSGDDPNVKFTWQFLKRANTLNLQVPLLIQIKASGLELRNQPALTGEALPQLCRQPASAKEK
jgi:hypothetical protein